METAAALQSAAKPGSVLLGPATQAATEGIVEWGPVNQVALDSRRQPLDAVYLVRPKARRPGFRGERGAARSSRMVGRQTELSTLADALRQATAGTRIGDFCRGRAGARQNPPGTGVP